MAFLLPLLRDVGLAFLGGALLSAFVTRVGGPLGTGQLGAIGRAFTWGAVGGALLVGAAAWGYTRTFRSALARASGLSREEAVAAAVSAHRLPIRLGLTGFAVALAGVLSYSARALGSADAFDLAWAGVSVGVGNAILVGMLCYSAASARVAGAIEGLGQLAEAGLRGTVRGKIMVASVGVFLIAILVVGATAYARFRTELDRAWVDAALGAQQGAVAAAEADAKVAPSWQALTVFGVSHLPTAVLGPRGELLARAGTDGTRERGRSFTAAFGAGTILRVEGGWFVSTRTPRGVTIVSMLDDGVLWHRRREFVSALAGAALAVLVAATLLAWFAARSITHPFRSLGRAADRIAAGDLTASPPSVTRDEIGQLAADFRRMTVGLRALLQEVRTANAQVVAGARETAGIADWVRNGALEQHATVLAVGGSVEAMEGSMGQVTRGIDALQAFVEATTTVVGETASAFEEVRRKGMDLERAVVSTLADVGRLAASGRDAEKQLAELEAMAGEAGANLAAVRSSASAMEQTAGEGEKGARDVAEMAERASGIVLETVHGIETLRAAVGDAHRRISALGRRSDDINQVVVFIGEVAGRTNLLSLNASIIASQAGEHGKAFSVVADQIRELAAQISRSTKSIGDIIHSVREEVEATTALIDRGDALAGEGVQLARNSFEALTQIQRSTAAGSEAAGGMRRSAESHAGAAREVARLVQSIADGARAVTVAVQMVGRSVGGVDALARNVGAMADELTRALDAQVGGAGRQLETIGRLEAMIQDTTRAAKDHASANHRVRDSLRSLSARAAEHEGAVAGLLAVAEQLGREATALQERVGRFKLG